MNYLRELRGQTNASMRKLGAALARKGRTLIREMKPARAILHKEGT